MTTDDTAGLGRRDLFRVSAGAATAAAVPASTATAQDGNESGGGSGGNESGGGGSNQDGGSGGSGGESGEGGSGGGDDGPAVDGDTLALFGVAGVIAFLSPLALVALLFRNARREEERY